MAMSAELCEHPDSAWLTGFTIISAIKRNNVQLLSAIIDRVSQLGHVIYEHILLCNHYLSYD